MKIGIVGAALLAVALTALGSSAQAEYSPFGCACLHNQTQHVVKFRYKWGEGDWKHDFLRAGHHEPICWRYADGSTHSPPLSFQIDVDLTGSSAWTTYNLPRLQSRHNSCEAVARQAHYDISYRPNTNRQFLHMTHRE
jgi:hypothetical protein